jgi:hypothetical protein
LNFQEAALASKQSSPEERRTCVPPLFHSSTKTSQDFTMTKNIPGSRTNPEGIPQEGHGGSNVRGTQHQQGKDGNGAQKRQQEKKS